MDKDRLMWTNINIFRCGLDVSNSTLLIFRRNMYHTLLSTKMFPWFYLWHSNSSATGGNNQILTSSAWWSWCFKQLMCTLLFFRRNKSILLSHQRKCFSWFYPWHSNSSAKGGNNQYMDNYWETLPVNPWSLLSEGTFAEQGLWC